MTLKVGPGPPYFVFATCDGATSQSAFICAICGFSVRRCDGPICVHLCDLWAAMVLRALAPTLLEKVHIALRERNRDLLCVEADFDLTGDVPVDIPVVIGLDPGPDDEIHR